MKKDFLTFRERVQYAILAKRQIRTKSTIFSFHVIEFYGALGLEFVDTLRGYKPLLNYASLKWNLPKLVRIFVEDIRSADHLGCKFQDKDSYYHIRIDLNNLHELELQCENETDFRQRMLWIFLHECAHFKTEDEEEADSMVLDLVKTYVDR